MIEASKKESFMEKWEIEINEVLRDNGVLPTQEISIVVLYHLSEQTIWQRLNLFCQIFRRQFTRAYPSARLNMQTICLPGASVNDVLPSLRGPHILLAVVSVECLLELHEIPPLYEALASQDITHHAGIVARSTPLEKDHIRFGARFPTDVPSLAHSLEDDEVYTEAMQTLWSWAARIYEQL
jgi:hypothetical protein